MKREPLKALRKPVTHLLPIKNGSKFINESIGNLVKNSQSEDQILIINDGSSDNTLDLVNKFKSTTQNLEVISTSGIGLVKSLNLGLQNAHHDLVARYDIDDLYLSERVEKQLMCFSENIAAVFCDYQIESLNGKNLGYIPCAVKPMTTKISLALNLQTPHPGVLFNKNAVIDVGGYLESEFPAEDLGLWIRLAAAHRIVGVPLKLLKYRIHKNSITSTNRKKIIQKRENLIQKLSFPEKDLSDVLRQEISSYKSLEMCELRYLLHYLNIKKLTNLGMLTQLNSYLKELKMEVFSGTPGLLSPTYFYLRRKFYKRNF